MKNYLKAFMFIGAITSLYACGPVEEDTNNEQDASMQTQDDNNAMAQPDDMTPTMTPEEKKEGKEQVDPGVTCTQAACASEKWQRALPTRNTVSIGFSSGSSTRKQSFDSLGFVTGETSEAYIDLSDYIDEINDLMDDVFLTIEEAGELEPEEETDGYARWRLTQGSYDVVVELATDDGVTYDIWVDAVDSGVLFERAESGLTGSIVLNEDGTKESFEFLLDLEDFGVFDDIEVSSEIVITAEPFDEGLFVYTYDFAELDAQSATLAQTTYWLFEPGSGAIEHSYIADDGFEASEGEIYGRWDNDGGRLDSYVSIADSQGDYWEVVNSNCWAGGGAEVFDGLMSLHESEIYAETLGEPEDCVFEVLDGHPDPIKSIEDLFNTYGWEEADSYGDFPDELELGEWDDDYEDGGEVIDPVDDELCLDAAAFVEEELAYCEEVSIELDSLCSEGADLELQACADAISDNDIECEGLFDDACAFLYE